MQLWVPEEYITDSTQDAAFRQVIQDNIGHVRKRMTQQLTELTIPKFEIEYKDDIIEALQLGYEWY